MLTLRCRWVCALQHTGRGSDWIWVFGAYARQRTVTVLRRI